MEKLGATSLTLHFFSPAPGAYAIEGRTSAGAWAVIATVNIAATGTASATVALAQAENRWLRIRMEAD